MCLKWNFKNELLSCAADNNAFVIGFDASLSKWKSTLVNISGTSLRALGACDWSKNGDRFAIGGGTGEVYVGFFDKVNNQWDTVPITGSQSLTQPVRTPYFVSGFILQNTLSQSQR